MSTRMRFGIYKRDDEKKPWKVQLPDIYNPKRAIYVGIFATLNDAIEARDAARSDPAAWVAQKHLARLHAGRPAAALVSLVPSDLRPYIRAVGPDAFRLSLPFDGKLRTIGTYSSIEEAQHAIQHGKSLLSDIAQRAARTALATLAGQGDPDAERIVNDPRWDYENLPLTEDPDLHSALAILDGAATLLASPTQP
jgi:hypothetical protein